MWKVRRITWARLAHELAPAPLRWRADARGRREAPRSRRSLRTRSERARSCLCAISDPVCTLPLLELSTVAQVEIGVCWSLALLRDADLWAVGHRLSNHCGKPAACRAGRRRAVAKTLSWRAVAAARATVATTTITVATTTILV